MVAVTHHVDTGELDPAGFVFRDEAAPPRDLHTAVEAGRLDDSLGQHLSLSGAVVKEVPASHVVEADQIAPLPPPDSAPVAGQ